MRPHFVARAALQNACCRKLSGVFLRGRLFPVLGGGLGRFLCRGGYGVPTAQSIHRLATDCTMALQVSTSPAITDLNGALHRPPGAAVDAVAMHLRLWVSAMMWGAHLTGSLKQRQPCLRAFRDGITGRNAVQGDSSRLFLDFFCEEVESTLAATRVGLFGMQVVGRAVLVAFVGIGHQDSPFLVIHATRIGLSCRLTDSAHAPQPYRIPEADKYTLHDFRKSAISTLAGLLVRGASIRWGYNSTVERETQE